MKAVAVAQGMHQSANGKLGLGVAGTNETHSLASLFSSKRIHAYATVKKVATNSENCIAKQCSKLLAKVQYALKPFILLEGLVGGK